MRSRSIALALVAIAAFAGSAQAAPSCLSVTPGAARVTATAASPADCCTGRMRCAQFLSTSIVVRPVSKLRT